MSVDEAARHRLYNKVVKVLGEEEATTLMAHLPPGGWPNLATKQDIVELRQSMLEMERRLGAELKAHTLRTVLTANLAMAAVFAGIAFTAAGIA